VKIQARILLEAEFAAFQRPSLRPLRRPLRTLRLKALHRKDRKEREEPAIG
jgi:hypothetical protein